MVEHLKELYNFRELLFSFTAREIKLRYKQTILGISWAVIQPLFMMVIFTIVFSRFVKVSSEGLPYPIFSFSALLPWMFFSTSVSFGSQSLVINSNLVRKIYFPRETIPLASIFAAGVDFAIASVVFAALMVYYRIAVSSAVWYVLLLLPLQVLFSAAVVLILSATNVFFRDVRYTVPFLVQVWLYATPIAFSMEAVPERYRMLYVALNPLAGLIDGFRSILLHARPPLAGHLALVTFVTVGLFVASYAMFKRLERNFADVI